jgi:hypothetical protein
VNGAPASDLVPGELFQATVMGQPSMFCGLADSRVVFDHFVADGYQYSLEFSVVSTRGPWPRRSRHR